MNAPRFAPLDVFNCPLAGLRQIEASAGTGKTWNICGLYLRLLLERGMTVQQVLVVTFTKAATAELRERIRQRIVDALAWLRPAHEGGQDAGDGFAEQLVRAAADHRDLTDAEMVARLERALASFDEAAIHTIHGFCQRALADAPLATRMPLVQEQIEDDAAHVAQAANDFWRRHVAADDLDAALAAHLLSRGDDPARFARLLKRHLGKPLAREVWPEDSDDASRTAVADAAGVAQALSRLHGAAREAWCGDRAAIESTLREALAREAFKANIVDPGKLERALEAWDDRLGGDDALGWLEVDDPLLKRLDLLGSDKLASATKKKFAPPVHAFFEHAQALLDERTRAGERLERARLALLRRLLREGAQAQRAAKRRERVVAFDDMLFNLYERLASPESPGLAATLRARYPAALVDEFQDTDPLQFAVFRAIYAGDDAPAADADAAAPVFFVGDPKQAIYSFRNADLHTYLAAGAQAVGHYSLAANQRSTAALIRALNALFTANPRAFMLDGLDYQPVAVGAKPRTPLADASGGELAALQVWTLPDDPATGEPVAKRDADRLAADATAAEIARLLAAARRGELILGEGAAARPLAAGDIAVLVRSHAQGTRMRRALAALGVGSVELSQDSVLRSPDAAELARLLDAVLEPARERTLKAALATEAMGVDAEGLVALAQDEAALLATVQRFLDYRETWARRGVGVMLRQWMAAEGVAPRLLARPDGERRLTNLLHLFELLHEAGETRPTPDALLQWFRAQRQAPGAGEAAQLRLESDQDLVQIVTVHKSKGLEYPFVFCPFLWGAEAAPSDGLDGAAWHDDQGHAVIDYGHALRDPAHRDEVARRQRLEGAAESLRLVYVALTRAVHRCVLVAGCYAIPNRAGRSATASTRSVLNWLAAGAGLAPEDWFAHELGAPAIGAAWRALAARAPGDLAVRPLSDAPGVPLAPLERAPGSLTALVPPPVPAGWRIGSFSALVHGAHTDRAAVDHDLRAADAIAVASADDAAPDDGEDDDILRFPRGPAAGECIHQVFERVAFDRAETWPEAIARAVQQMRALGVEDERRPRGMPMPPPVPAADERAAADARHARRLRRMLGDVLATPLPIGTPTPLRLDTLPSSRRLVELEFHLPSHRLDARALNDTLAALGVDLPPLAFAPLQGFLKGFIDLVFEHEGRWFVLDWKSNHLGDSAAAYGRDAMATVMRDQGYHLQSLLYLVALDRHLRRRIPGYRTATHLGGTVYLFVRGVRPGWRDASGAPAGVFFERPAAHAIRRLSALFDAPDAAPAEAMR